MLFHNNLQLQHVYQGLSFQWQYIVDQFAVVLSHENMRVAEDPSMFFFTSVEIGFVLWNHLLLSIGSTTVALVRHGVNFYVINSHSRDSNGRIATNGVAVMMCFNSVQALHSYLLSVYSTCSLIWHLFAYILM